MRKKVEIERIRGEGEVRLPDGTAVPSRYDVRVLESRERIVTNQGEEWLPSGFKSLSVTLDHGGHLQAPLSSAGNMFLEMEDGRRIELLWKRQSISDGVIEVVATGGILPAE